MSIETNSDFSLFYVLATFLYVCAIPMIFFYIGRDILLSNTINTTKKKESLNDSNDNIYQVMYPRDFLFKLFIKNIMKKNPIISLKHVDIIYGNIELPDIKQVKEYTEIDRENFLYLAIIKIREDVLYGSCQFDFLSSSETILDFYEIVFFSLNLPRTFSTRLVNCLFKNIYGIHDEEFQLNSSIEEIANIYCQKLNLMLCIVFNLIRIYHEKEHVIEHFPTFIGSVISSIIRLPVYMVDMKGNDILPVKDYQSIFRMFLSSLSIQSNNSKLKKSSIYQTYNRMDNLMMVEGFKYLYSEYVAHYPISSLGATLSNQIITRLKEYRCQDDEMKEDVLWNINALEFVPAARC